MNYTEIQSRGLTDAERKEQKILRQEYLELVRRNLRSQLNILMWKKKTERL